MLLPLSLTWTLSCWPLGGDFCHMDPSLAFLTFWVSGRLLTRVAANCYTALGQPAWELGHRRARRVVFWSAGFWLLLVSLGRLTLRAVRTQASLAVPYNRTPATGSPGLDQDSRPSGPLLDQMVFGFGVPLGVLSTFHRVLRAQLQLARLSGWPPTAEPVLGHRGRALSVLVPFPPADVARSWAGLGGRLGAAQTPGGHPRGDQRLAQPPALCVTRTFRDGPVTGSGRGGPGTGRGCSAILRGPERNGGLRIS